MCERSGTSRKQIFVQFRSQPEHTRKPLSVDTAIISVSTSFRCRLVADLVRSCCSCGTFRHGISWRSWNGKSFPMSVIMKGETKSFAKYSSANKQIPFLCTNDLSYFARSLLLLVCLLACTSKVWSGDYWDRWSQDAAQYTYAHTHIHIHFRARAPTHTRHTTRERDCNINLTDSRGSKHCRKCYHLRHTRVCRWRGTKSMVKNRQASAEHRDRRMLSSHRWGENKKMRSVSRRRGCNTSCTISLLEKLNHLAFSWFHLVPEAGTAAWGCTWKGHACVLLGQN